MQNESSQGRKQISDTWELGSSYERYVGRWSRQIAPLFLDWLNIPSGQRWLDVGCGTGALSAAILDRCAPGSVAGVEPSEGFRKTALAKLAGRVSFYPGNAAKIPLPNSSVDVVVSGLVLNFAPDPHAALVEMVRVTGHGGTIAGYVWDYAGKMEMMRFFWDTAAELDGKAVSLDEGVRFPLCDPDALLSLFGNAGLTGAVVKAIDTQTPFASFDDFWQPFLGGQGPGPAYVMTLEPAMRMRLRDRLRERLPIGADGSIHLIARAWAFRAAVKK